MINARNLRDFNVYPKKIGISKEFDLYSKSLEEAVRLQTEPTKMMGIIFDEKRSGQNFDTYAAEEIYLSKAVSMGKDKKEVKPYSLPPSSRTPSATALSETNKSVSSNSSRHLQPLKSTMGVAFQKLRDNTTSLCPYISSSSFQQSVQPLQTADAMTPIQAITMQEFQETCAGCLDLPVLNQSLQANGGFVQSNMCPMNALKRLQVSAQKLQEGITSYHSMHKSMAALKYVELRKSSQQTIQPLQDASSLSPIQATEMEEFQETYVAFTQRPNIPVLPQSMQATAGFAQSKVCPIKISAYKLLEGTARHKTKIQNNHFLQLFTQEFIGRIKHPQTTDNSSNTPELHQTPLPPAVSQTSVLIADDRPTETQSSACKLTVSVPAQDENTSLMGSKASRNQVDTECKVCFEEVIQTAFQPCGHLVCCSACADLMKECPVCRTRVEGQFRIYF